MGALSVEYLQTTGGTVNIPVRELQVRVVQSVRSIYNLGTWNPDNTYNWIPGAFSDFTPRRADTRIRYFMRLPHYWHNASHSISHYYFWAANILYYYWSESGTFLEDGNTFQFEVPSWGTTSGRIGLQHRAYSNDFNEQRMYGTTYWDGVGSVQNAIGQLIVEEIMA